MAANATANLVRNLWTHSVIMCGHFPDGVETFERTSIEGETRGEWYLRQMLGSANISGSKLMHIMTGNLSHQIEHHLFPDLPSNRYGEIAPKIQDIFQRYGLSYITGPLPKQVGSAWAKVFRLSLPNRKAGDRRVAGGRGGAPEGGHGAGAGEALAAGHVIRAEWAAFLTRVKHGAVRPVPLPYGGCAWVIGWTIPGCMSRPALSLTWRARCSGGG